MDAEKLLVHERRQRQAVERVHARVIHSLRVFYFTWKDKTTKKIIIGLGAQAAKQNEMKNKNVLLRMETSYILTFLFKSKVFCQVPTLVVST